MLILIGLFLFVIIYVYFFRETFFSELAISFVPYIIVLCAIAILIQIFLLFRYKGKSLNTFFTVIFLILSIGIGILYSSEFFFFYNQPHESIRLNEDEKGIKVFYANILYSNTNFESLQQKIEIENPDIVILVEFSDAHENAMKDFFRENYPYMNRNSRSTTLAGDVVFSKFPLENITETHLVKAGSRNYSFMTITADDNYIFDLYVIHTAAPVSYKNFLMRNDQLNKFKFDYIKTQRVPHPTIIIGDFNLSPWSYYYKKLTNNRNMINALSFQSPNYTRSLLQQGIFRSHIDQIFISPEIKISEVNIENLTGSDHRSFLFKFGNN